MPTYRGGRKSFAVSAAVSASLAALSRCERVTPFMTLLAAFQTQLHRYTGRHDIVVGTVIANRNRVETEALIGFFVNLLVLRTDVSGDPSFTQLLRRVREVCLGAFAHQDLPFEKLVEVLRPERNVSATPLVQAVFALQNAPDKALALPGLELSLLASEHDTVRHDLVLSMVHSDRGLTGTWKYDSDLFDGATVDRMSSHFTRLLASIVEQPAARLSRLEMLMDEEKLQTLADEKRREESKSRKFKDIRARTVG